MHPKVVMVAVLLEVVDTQVALVVMVILVEFLALELHLILEDFGEVVEVVEQEVLVMLDIKV
jgi:hypothetical protein